MSDEERDRVVLDWNMIWSTIMTDLPTLKHVCEEYLNN